MRNRRKPPILGSQSAERRVKSPRRETSGKRSDRERAPTRKSTNPERGKSDSGRSHSTHSRDGKKHNKVLKQLEIIHLDSSAHPCSERELGIKYPKTIRRIGDSSSSAKDSGKFRASRDPSQRTTFVGNLPVSYAQEVRLSLPLGPTGKLPRGVRKPLRSQRGIVSPNVPPRGRTPSSSASHPLLWEKLRREQQAERRKKLNARKRASQLIGGPSDLNQQSSDSSVRFVGIITAPNDRKPLFCNICKTKRGESNWRDHNLTAAHVEALFYSNRSNQERSFAFLDRKFNVPITCPLCGTGFTYRTEYLSHCAASTHKSREEELHKLLKESGTEWNFISRPYYRLNPGHAVAALQNFYKFREKQQ